MFMPRRSKEQVLAEFHHLYDCFEVALDVFSNLDEVFHIADKEDVVTRSQMLAWVVDGKTTASGLVAGVRAGIGDIERGLGDLERNRPEDARKFEAQYIARRQMSFLHDIEQMRPTLATTT